MSDRENDLREEQNVAIKDAFKNILITIQIPNPDINHESSDINTKNKKSWRTRMKLILYTHGPVHVSVFELICSFAVEVALSKGANENSPQP